MNLPKWLVGTLGALLIAFVALLVVQKLNDLRLVFKNEKPANTISISGEGKVIAVPDLATVTLGVYSQALLAEDLKNENDKKINKIIAFVKDLGVDSKDISTSQYDLQPRHQYTGGDAKLIGYQITQAITVKVHIVNKDTSVLNKIIDGAVSNGANQINGVNMSVEKPTDLQNEARKLAIEDAKKKAQELATASGLKLGRIVSVAESSGGHPGPIPYYMDSAMGMGMGGEAKSIAPNIQPGSQEITMMMSVTFELK